MGCNESKPATSASSASPHESATPHHSDDPLEATKSGNIDRDLDRARQQEELKVKLLLLGAGESGKSTIFKQMRILYGSPRSDDDLRMYGVLVRSNVITAMRKLCGHLRGLQLQEQLAADSANQDEDSGENGGGNRMTPTEAFDLVCAHLIDNTGDPADLDPPPNGKDWVGHIPRAGLNPNNDANLFLQLWKPIKVLWEVSLFVFQTM